MKQHCGFDPPLRRIFSGRRDFSLGVNMGSDSIPQKLFQILYKPRSSQCTHAFHHTDSKDPDIHVPDGWMPATKTQPACTIHEDGMWLPLWQDYKRVTHAKISPKMVNPRGKLGNAEEEEETTPTLLQANCGVNSAWSLIYFLTSWPQHDYSWSWIPRQPSLPMDTDYSWSWIPRQLSLTMDTDILQLILNTSSVLPTHGHWHTTADPEYLVSPPYPWTLTYYSWSWIPRQPSLPMDKGYSWSWIPHQPSLPMDTDILQLILNTSSALFSHGYWLQLILNTSSALLTHGHWLQLILNTSSALFSHGYWLQLILNTSSALLTHGHWHTTADPEYLVSPPYPWTLTYYSWSWIPRQSPLPMDTDILQLILNTSSAPLTHGHWHTTVDPEYLVSPPYQWTLTYYSWSWIPRQPSLAMDTDYSWSWIPHQPSLPMDTDILQLILNTSSALPTYGNWPQLIQNTSSALLSHGHWLQLILNTSSATDYSWSWIPCQPSLPMDTDYSWSWIPHQPSLPMDTAPCKQRKQLPAVPLVSCLVSPG